MRNSKEGHCGQLGRWGYSAVKDILVEKKGNKTKVFELQSLKDEARKNEACVG